MGDLAKFSEAVYTLNLAHGWYDSDRTPGDDIALLVTEVGELFDAYRDYGFEDRTATAWAANHGGESAKPEGVGSEAADVLIRLLDLTRRWGIDLEEEYHRKMRFNASRPYKHGGKRL